MERSHNLIPNMDKDCAGVCHGMAFVDACGHCSGPGTPFVPNSDRDDCGVCTGKGTGKVWNANKDCAGQCFGQAAYDECNVCSGGITGRTAGETRGCDGVCAEPGADPKVDCPQGFFDFLFGEGSGEGIVVLTSAGSLLGLALVICIMVVRSRLRETREAERENRRTPAAAPRAVDTARAGQFADGGVRRKLQ